MAANEHKKAAALVLRALVKNAKDLTPAARAKIKKKNFAIPERADTPEEKKKPGNYPIHDREHARAALGFVAMHGTPEEKAKVRRKVCQKYPDMPTCKKMKRKKGGDDYEVYRVLGRIFGKVYGRV